MKNSRQLDLRMVSILFLLSSAIIAVGSVTMALTHKDREITKLMMQATNLESKNREFLSSILSCANGEGFLMQLTPQDLVEVDCSIKYEWMNGRFYEKNSGRQPRKPMIRKKK